MAGNQLKMNPEKTEVSLFVSKRQRDKVSASSLKVAGETVVISEGSSIWEYPLIQV